MLFRNTYLSSNVKSRVYNNKGKKKNEPSETSEGSKYYTNLNLNLEIIKQVIRNFVHSLIETL
jgi:hypothetical protein